MWRFAHLAKEGKGKFRAVQFGLNLGRTQELLGSMGGVNAWWRKFEPLTKPGEEQYEKIILVVGQYLELLDLPKPEEEFINRM